MKRFINVLYHVLVGIVILVTIYIFGRVFVMDTCLVHGPSMEPTLHEGQHLIVNKLAMGARIYTKFNFDSPELKCFRMPGFSQLRPGDIAVFNYPYGWEKNRIGFKINYVYAKRCIGCPGDYVEIHRGRFINNRRQNISLGDERMQRRLGETPDSLLLKRGIVLKAYKHKYTNWTIKEFGPLRVPYKGLNMEIDSTVIHLYSRIIEYETGKKAHLGNYTFQEDYYFFAGDNVFDSKDSRYFGFVPESFIVGKAEVHSNKL